jgi:hypothetical protein
MNIIQIYRALISTLILVLLNGCAEPALNRETVKLTQPTVSLNEPTMITSNRPSLRELSCSYDWNLNKSQVDNLQDFESKRRQDTEYLDPWFWELLTDVSRCMINH